MTPSSTVNLAVIGPVSTALLANVDIELPPTVALHRHLKLGAPLRPSNEGNSDHANVIVWWCVADGGSVTPELWSTSRAWRDSGAVVLVFVLGAAPIDAPNDAPMWFHLTEGQEALALCPHSMIWSSLGNSSHIALDWNDLRAITNATGQAQLWEVSAATQEELIAQVAPIARLRQWGACYLHFEGAALQGITLKQLSRLFSDNARVGADQIITYEPGREPERFLVRALLR